MKLLHLRQDIGPRTRRTRCGSWPVNGGRAWQLDHVDNGRNQEDAGCEHQDFSNVEAGKEKHSSHGYPQSSTRHREDCAIGTAAKIRTWNTNARLLSADRIDPKPGSQLTEPIEHVNRDYCLDRQCRSPGRKALYARVPSFKYPIPRVHTGCRFRRRNLITIKCADCRICSAL